MASFEEGATRLAEAVGTGKLEGSVTFEQFYAVYVHEILENHHPIGQAKYLETPLHAKTDAYMQELADKAITEDGSDLTKAMEDAAEDLASEAADLCPKDLTILSRSDHVTVTSEGEVVFDRPAEAERLSEEESEQVHGHKDATEHRKADAKIVRQTDEDRTRGRGMGRRINPG